MRISAICFLFSFLIFIISGVSEAHPSFFYMGDGQITMSNGLGGGARTIKFRSGDGNYKESALKDINNIFGASWSEPEWRISLRLIELLDFIQDHFNGGGIAIIDGFRSVDRNEAMRSRGKLAASSSLHLDGEAADIVMAGVRSADIYNYLVPLNCCGVGYYHGKAIHIDIGPPRFWDEKTSGTEKKEPPLNEKIAVRTDRDIYEDGEPLTLQFSRVNIYPFGVVRSMNLEVSTEKGWKSFDISPHFPSDVKGGESRGCIVIANRKAGRDIEWQAREPKGKEVKCRIRLKFCNPKTEKMPEELVSNEFLIKPKTP